MEEKFERGMRAHEWDVCGGKGGANMLYLLSDADIADPVKVSEFREIRLDAGARCGFHEVMAKAECWYVVSGEGVYKSDKEEFPVHAGDFVVCDRGNSHALDNTSKDFLTYIALTIE